MAGFQLVSTIVSGFLSHMGFSITWIACPETHADDVLGQLNLVPTDEADDAVKSPFSMFRTSAGWRIIWAKKYGHPLLDEDAVARLSAGPDIILTLVEEHVMASSSELWSQGSRRWRISHEGENGPIGLEVEGQPPPAFPEIRAAMEKEQEKADEEDDNVDYLFEIPLCTAQSITGFKHDAVHDGKFEALRYNPRKPVGFFKRLFGS